MKIKTGPPPKTSSEATQLQSAMLVRAGVYGVACSLYFAITLLYTQCMSEPDRGIIDTLAKSAEDISYWLPGFLLLIPVAIHDLMKLSSQVSKPITELRNEFAMLIAGKSERPLSTNEGDYWNELTQAYNQVRGELLQLRKRLGEEDDDASSDTAKNSNGPLTVTEMASRSIEDTVRLEHPPIMPLSMPVTADKTSATV